MPSTGPDEALMEWLARLLRLSASPAAARAILDFAATVDMRDLLGAIAVQRHFQQRRLRTGVAMRVIARTLEQEIRPAANAAAVTGGAVRA